MQLYLGLLQSFIRVCIFSVLDSLITMNESMMKAFCIDKYMIILLVKGFVLA